MDWVPLVGIAITACIGVLTLWSTFFLWLLKKLDAIETHLGTQDVTIGVMQRELFEDSGSTMRDSIEATAKKIARIEGRMGIPAEEDNNRGNRRH